MDCSAFQILMSTFFSFLFYSCIYCYLQFPSPFSPHTAPKVRIMHVIIVNKLCLKIGDFLLSLECPAMHKTVTFALVIFLSRSLALLSLLSKGKLHFLRYILCASAHNVLINNLKLSQVFMWQWFICLLRHLCFSIAKCNGLDFVLKK